MQCPLVSAAMARKQSQHLLRASRDRPARTQGLNLSRSGPGSWSSIWIPVSKHHLSETLDACTRMAPSQIKGKKKKTTKLSYSRSKHPLKNKFNRRRLSSYKTFRRTKHLNVHRLCPEMAERLLAQLLQALASRTAPGMLPSPSAVAKRDTATTARTQQSTRVSPDPRTRNFSKPQSTSHFVLHFVSSSLFKDLSGPDGPVLRSPELAWPTSPHSAWRWYLPPRAALGLQRSRDRRRDTNSGQGLNMKALRNKVC